MKLQLIRNACMRLEYDGRVVLSDPMLSDKGAIESFAGQARNPTVDLPLSLAEITAGLEAVLVSHVHQDHFDPAAGQALPKDIPLFCQPGDEAKLAGYGFHDIRPVADSLTWQGISLSRTGGHHGQGAILERLGQVSGFILKAAGEPTVYWAGDTIWCDEVAQAIQTHKPDIVITHSGGAALGDSGPIVMNAVQTIQTAQAALAAAPGARVVAIHLEALDHCSVSRTELRRLAEEKGLSSEQLLIPADGEVLSF